MIDRLSSKGLRFVPALFAAWLLACGADAGGAAGDARREAKGERGLVSFVVDAEKPLLQGENDLRISLRDAATGAPLTGAELDVSALMPAMGHESPTPASIEELGGGEYAVHDLALPMPGRWEVHIVATRGETSDEARFDYDIP